MEGLIKGHVVSGYGRGTTGVQKRFRYQMRARDVLESFHKQYN